MITPTHLFITEATLLKPVVVQDPGGSPTQTFEVHSTFMCRLVGPPAGDVEGAGLGTRSFYAAICYCAHDVPIAESDRLLIAGDYWDVTGMDNTDLMDVYLSVRVKRSK